ncbi:VWA domain-containing protein [Candidatus Uabimicrobium sp. HlEnr_7]|uniref:VWA domain-containing protein n=1 Tax=Candidatus Uabimicrobium helgolandensis TaxID=3095367 RepID=UPI0035583256
MTSPSFSEHLTQFYAYIKAQGLIISIAEEICATQAIMHIDILDRPSFYFALQTCLAKTRSQQQIFHRAFYEYWYAGVIKQKANQDANSCEENKKNNSKKMQNLPSVNSQGNKSSSLQAMFTYSPLHQNKQQQFVSKISQRLKDTIDEIARQLAQSLNRNYKRAKKNRINMRNTIYKNRKYHPDILRLYFRDKKKQRLKLVILCDTSYSMKNYNNFFLQFIFAFAKYYPHITPFLFNTKLYQINAQIDNSYHTFSRLTPQSGTRIGESLAEFLQKYLHLINKSTYVIIVSDGWDRGNINTIENALQQIDYYSKGIIWLNPWSATSGFEPTSRCMKIAKPYIKILSSVHDISSLEKFAHLLVERKNT